MRRRLLERLLDQTEGSSREDVEDSILGSLRRIFNSVQGDASTDLAFGLPDARSIARGMPESVDRLKREIERVIRDYEPRLRRVRVEAAEQETSTVLQFVISAELNDPEGDTGVPLKFETRLRRSGGIEVDR